MVKSIRRSQDGASFLDAHVHGHPLFRWLCYSRTGVQAQRKCRHPPNQKFLMRHRPPYGQIPFDTAGMYRKTVQNTKYCVAFPISRRTHGYSPYEWRVVLPIITLPLSYVSISSIAAMSIYSLTVYLVAVSPERGTESRSYHPPCQARYPTVLTFSSFFSGVGKPDMSSCTIRRQAGKYIRTFSNMTPHPLSQSMRSSSIPGWVRQ